MKKSFLLPLSCSAFLIAITALSFDYICFVWGLIFIALTMAVGASLKGMPLQHVYVKLFILILIAIIFALFRYDQNLELSQSFNQYHFQKTEISAYVQSQETRSTTRQRLTVKVLSSNYSDLDEETILVNTGRFPLIAKGDLLDIDCVLERPEPFEGFAYDKYLASQGIYLLCQNAKIEITGQDISLWRHPLEYGRIEIASAISEMWSRPVSSLVAGLLLGTRESFPEKTLLDFRRAGVTHIIALSGFNITILIVFLEAMAIRLLIPLRVRLYLLFGGIILFTIFVGAGASITRAAIMGSLALLCKNVARDVSPLRIMIITAAVMTAFQPFVLMYDVGFQLSFVSTLGLIYLTPLFERFLGWLPAIMGIRESLTTTLAATVVTLPLILYQFEQLSVVSPIANMLILPLIPWLMALGALAVLSFWLIPFIAPILSWVVDFGCQYVLDVSKITASWSWSAVPLSLPFYGMVGGYIVLTILMVLGSGTSPRPPPT